MGSIYAAGCHRDLILELAVKEPYFYLCIRLEKGPSKILLHLTHNCLEQVVRSRQPYVSNAVREDLLRDHNLFFKYFFSHIRHCSFDLLTVTFQGQTFFDNS